MTAGREHLKGWQTPNKSPQAQQEAPPALVPRPRLTRPLPSRIRSRAGKGELQVCVGDAARPRSFSALPVCQCVCLSFNCSPPPTSTQSAVGDGIVHTINANPAGLIPSCLSQAINPWMHSPRVSHANRGLPRTEKHPVGPSFMRFCETAFGGWRGERAVLGIRLTRRSDSLGLFPQNLANSTEHRRSWCRRVDQANKRPWPVGDGPGSSRDRVASVAQHLPALRLPEASQCRPARTAAQTGFWDRPPASHVRETLGQAAGTWNMEHDPPETTRHMLWRVRFSSAQHSSAPLRSPRAVWISALQCERILVVAVCPGPKLPFPGA